MSAGARKRPPETGSVHSASRRRRMARCCTAMAADPWASTARLSRPRIAAGICAAATRLHGAPGHATSQPWIIFMDGPMTAQTRLFLCMKDNYGVLVHDPATGATAAIDAPEAAPVEAALAATGWKLTDILVTHHHADHTAGIAELKQRHHCRVVAPRREAAKIPDVDVEVGEGDTRQGRLAHGGGDRDARPYARPDQLLLSGGQAPVRRRHAVLDRLRAGDRRQAGADVAVAAQAARAARRHLASIAATNTPTPTSASPSRSSPAMPRCRPALRRPRSRSPRARRPSRARSARKSAPTSSCGPTTRRSRPRSVLPESPRRRCSPRCGSARTGSDMTDGHAER